MEKFLKRLVTNLSNQGRSKVENIDELNETLAECLNDNQPAQGYEWQGSPCLNDDDYERPLVFDPFD